MRIAVAVPPIRDFYLTPHRLSALGARIVAELCRKAGHEVRLFRFPSKERSHVLPLPPEASYLEPYLVPAELGPLSFFTRFQHFGPTFEECSRQISVWRPEAVFISSFAYAYAEEAVELARAVRRKIPGARLVVGGAGPSSCPEYYFKQVTQNQDPHDPVATARPCGSATQKPLFDFVVVGEGEVTVPLLLEKLERLVQKRGPISDTEPQVIRADHLCREEEISVPVAIVKETSEGIWVTTSLSRGCPKRCRFCSNHLCHGSEFRTAPLQALEQALRRLPPKPILHLNFEDDNLLSAPEYFFEVLEMVKILHPYAQFSAENGLDYLLLDPPTIDRLIQYGFRRFNLSLGTIYPETALQVDRPVDLSRYLEVIREIHNRGASSITYFIAGLTGDAPERIVEQIRFLQPLPTLIGISLFYPVPGIPGFTPPPSTLLDHPGLGRGSFAYPWTGALTMEELVTAFRLCRYVNLLKKERKTAEEEALVQRIQETKRLLTFAKRSGSHRAQCSRQKGPKNLEPEGLGENMKETRWTMGEAPSNCSMVNLFFSH